MMPLPLILALMLAFGLRQTPPAGFAPRLASLPTWSAVAAILAAVILSSLVVGQLLEWFLVRTSSSLPRQRERVAQAGRLLDALNLLAFGLIVLGLDWTGFVDSALGLSQAVLVDELLIVAPFLLGQLAVWGALAGPEHQLHRRIYHQASERSTFSSWLLKVRGSCGLILPAIGIYALGTDLASHLWPGLAADPFATLAGMILLGTGMLVAAPLLVRLAWPTRRLEDGPLRERLEALARRLHFRYADILVWETDHTIANAGITGTLPWFRYVLLTDTLIDRLTPAQVEAVFGHEVGHVAHRHLGYFGFFFLGSIGLLALLGMGFGALLGHLPFEAVELPGHWSASEVIEMAGAVLGLTVLGVYMYLVFGFLSRRFERQADLYGCRAVSCGRSDCPDHEEGEIGTPGPAAAPLCPTSIRTFAQALSFVAILNGMDLMAPTWRHGSIERRIRFLEQLEGQPEAERRFQGRVWLLRSGLAVVLMTGLAAAVWTGALERL